MNNHSNVKDIAGRRFGRLVVVKRVGSCYDRQVLWRCICDCGAEKDIAAGHLNHGRTLSCGCLARESTSARFTGRPGPNKMPPGVAALNHLIGMYKRGARLRGLEWSLTKQEAEHLFRGVCNYCGIEPTQSHFSSSQDTQPFTYNGIDRVDNSTGYTPSNTVSCCVTCNYAKRDMESADFLAWAKRLHENLTRKGLA
jgi:hypothetical protein